MLNGIGYSVYLSNYEQMKEQLSSLYREGSCVFTSFHISEELDETYQKRAAEMCRELRDMGYEILADVSKKTLAMFSCEDIVEFARRMEIAVLRIDYGFCEEEMIGIGRRMPICINASTVSAESAGRIVKSGANVYAMHNFYPRPETGLDEEFFDRTNEGLREAGVKVLAFIPSGGPLFRGPIYEGLPTLEAHRGKSPYASYVDMKAAHTVDGIFVGDGMITPAEAEWIRVWEQDGVLTLPVDLTAEGESLYDRIFTVREDSPKWLKRLKESREYSCFGEEIQPKNCIERTSGTITVDNIGYKRYSGEVQVMIGDFAADRRVNVLGRLEERYHGLLKNIGNGGRVVLQRDKRLKQR